MGSSFDVFLNRRNKLLARNERNPHSDSSKMYRLKQTKIIIWPKIRCNEYFEQILLENAVKLKFQIIFVLMRQTDIFLLNSSQFLILQVKKKLVRKYGLL